MDVCYCLRNHADLVSRSLVSCSSLLRQQQQLGSMSKVCNAASQTVAAAQKHNGTQQELPTGAMHTLLLTALEEGMGVLARESAWSFSRDLSLPRAGLSTVLAKPLGVGAGRGLPCFGVCWGVGVGVAGASTHMPAAACNIVQCEQWYWTVHCKLWLACRQGEYVHAQ